LASSACDAKLLTSIGIIIFLFGGILILLKQSRSQR
jgi:hypothetical protein